MLVECLEVQLFLPVSPNALCLGGSLLSESQTPLMIKLPIPTEGLVGEGQKCWHQKEEK